MANAIIGLDTTPAFGPESEHLIAGQAVPGSGFELGSSNGQLVDWDSLGRFDPFRRLSAAEKQSQLDGYRQFLFERDGELDFRSRVLPKREAELRAIESQGATWRGHTDRDAFYEHYYGPGATPLDARTNWLLIISAFNVNEIFAVEGEIQRWLKRGLDGADPCVLYDLLEEQYHGRILIEACRASGLGEVRLKPPRWFTRQMIHVMQRFPDGIRFVGILCGEALGCAVLRILLDRIGVFEEEPEVQDRIRSLLEQILLDETGHTLFCRATMPDWALALSRRAVVPIAAGLMREVPHLSALGVTHRELYARLCQGIPIPPSMESWLPAE